MAEKKTFVFYKGWAEAIKEMPDDIRLEVYDCIIEYAFSGKIPSLKPMAKIAFNFIKNDIDLATDKYNKKVEINRINGANGGRPKKTENQQITETQQNPKNPVGFSETQQNPHEHDNEHEHDNDILFTKESKLREVWELFRGKRNSFEKDFKAFEKKTEGIEVDFEKLKREAVKCSNIYFQTWLNDFVPKSSGTGGGKIFSKDDFFKKLINLGVDEKDARVWMEVRKQKKAVFTEYVIDLIVEECERHSLDLSEAIKYSAKYSWQGFDYEWYQNKKNKENGTHNNTKQSNSNGSGYSTGRNESYQGGKTSFNQILARKLKASSDSESGNITIDAEVVERR